ncbi:MAG: ArnT family glycosyltransferase [Spirochaetaceae bacterium]
MMRTFSLSTTEPFFDLIPRYPHAIKSLFHLVHMPFITLFGFSPFSLRLISLITGFAGLYFFYRLLKGYFKSPVPTGICILLMLDIQFVYASRFARQEIILFTALIIALLLFQGGCISGKRSQFRLAAMVIGLSIGFHPNSFLIALPVGAFYCVRFLFERDKSSLRDIAEYAGILLLCALFFTAISLTMDPAFLSHYAAAGERLEVGVPLYIKFFRFPDFYLKLFYGISGTYYTPDIRLQFFLFALVSAVSLPLAVCKAERRRLIVSLLTALVFLNAGTLVLGKYSQPSIIFHFPLYYMLLAAVLEEVPGHLFFSAHIKKGILSILAGLLLISTGVNVVQEMHLLPPKDTTPFESYREYNRNIRSFVPADAMVLANLNSLCAFDFGRVRDYRNLAHLDEAGLDFSEYIELNGIEYIIYPEEMDFIYRNRPVWNILYGNVTGYYKEMKEFLEEECTVAGSFSSPTYGMRITRYSGTRPWEVTVYRVRR